MSAKNFLEFSCGLTQFFMWFKGESWWRGGERRNGETENFMGKQDSWLLMANQFSFCNEKLSRFSYENMTPAPRGKMRCVTRKIIHIITTFLPESTLSHTKEFFLNAFNGEKKMKIRLRSVAFKGLIRKWCRFGVSFEVIQGQLENCFQYTCQNQF